MIQRLGQEGADHVVGQRRPIQSFEIQRFRLGQGCAFRPFQGQHPLAHPLPHDLGRGHIGVERHDLAHLAGGGGL